MNWIVGMNQMNWTSSHSNSDNKPFDIQITTITKESYPVLMRPVWQLKEETGGLGVNFS